MANPNSFSSKWPKSTRHTYGLANNWYQSKPGKHLEMRQHLDFLQRELRGQRKAKLGSCIKQISRDCKEMLRKKLDEIMQYNTTLNQPQSTSTAQDKYKNYKCFQCKQLGHIVKFCPMDDNNKDMDTKTYSSNFAREGEVSLKPSKPSVMLKYPESIHFSTKCMIKKTDHANWDDICLAYMFDSKESQKFDEDKMRILHNNYLEDYFESLAQKNESMEEDLIKIKGNLYSTEEWDFSLETSLTSANITRNAVQKAKGKMDHFGVKLEDTEEEDDSQEHPILLHSTKAHDLQGMELGTSRTLDKEDSYNCSNYLVFGLRTTLHSRASLGVIGVQTPGNEDLILVHDALGYAYCRLSLAIPENGIFENINSVKELAQMPQWTAEKPLRVLGSKLMGVADVIVDLVSSGTTLKENYLKEIEGGVLLKIMLLDAEDPKKDIRLFIHSTALRLIWEFLVIDSDYSFLGIKLEQRAMRSFTVKCQSVASPSDGKSERSEIRLGLPSKGRMAADTLDLFKDCRLSVRCQNPRDYVADIPRLANLEVWFQCPKDIVQELVSGDLDLGIVGLDMLSEYGQSKPGKHLEMRQHLDFLQRELRRQRKAKLGSCIKQISKDCKEMLRKKLDEIMQYNTTLNQPQSTSTAQDKLQSGLICLTAKNVQEFDEDKMRLLHNNYLEAYFESLANRMEKHGRKT
ncbi:ARID DNA-binding domain-containing protein [Tanacetum coccineum]|uniref:ATP phosphoribosyltransferase n=1 Tax=Tanacetum coccineum TaxID=301880 RepID=A0ABQ5BLX5_9ASTR